jgi:hypothetical protein
MTLTFDDFEFGGLWMTLAFNDLNMDDLGLGLS